jgi:hypothetical protein
LFNTSKGDWVTFNGITYEDFFNKIDEDIFVSDDGESYLVTIYSISNVPDDRSFYILSPLDDGLNGYFVSHIKWLELQEKLEKEGEETNFDRENDSDISERKKGL